MTTAIYQRASDVKQDEDGISIETQNETVKKFCEYKGYENVKYYTEIKSARTMKGRDQLNQMVKDIKSGHIKRVVVYRLDRLTRSLRDLMNLLYLFEEKECELHSTYENIDTSTPSGRMLVQVLGMIGEWESANTSMRVRNSMMYQAQQGRWMSVAPYGFDLIDGTLHINAHEHNMLTVAFDKILDDGYSFSAAERYVNKQHGTDWKPDFLTRKIDQESTIGNTYRNGKVFRNTHEPLFSEEYIERLKEIRDSRIVNKSNTSHNDLFRLRIRCYQCGNALSLNPHKRPNGYYYNYTCTQCFKRGRGYVGIAEGVMERSLLKYMSRLPITGLDDHDKDKTEQEKHHDELNKRLIELDKRKDRIQRAWIDDLIPDEDLNKYQKEITKEENEILDNLGNLKVTRKVSKEELKELKVMFTDHYDELTRDEKVSFVQRHIKEIHYKRHKIANRRYRTEIKNIVFL